MTDGRSVIDVATPAGGWAYPWPNVAEIETELPHTHWTLIGGLMVQLHAINHGLAVVRPTNDVDIVVHVETGRGRHRTTAQVLTGLGYEIQPEQNRREAVAHRFRRNQDTVDVVVADHAAPRVRRRAGQGLGQPLTAPHRVAPTITAGAGPTVRPAVSEAR